MAADSSAAWWNRSKFLPMMTVGQFLRRGWSFVALGLILGVALGVITLRMLPPTYSAKAAVLVRPVGVSAKSTSGDRLVSDVNLDTEAQLVKSLVIAKSAAKALDSGQSSTALIESVSVEVPPNTTILSISFSASTAEAAAAGAQAFATAYLDHRRESAAQDVDDQLDKLNTQLDSLDQRLEELIRSIVSLPENNSTRLIEQTRLQLVRSRFASLQSYRTTLESATISPGEIISDARPPASAAAPDPFVVVAAACALGLLAGLGLAWLTRFRYYRLAAGDDVAAMTGRSLLASVPGRSLDTMTRHQVTSIQQAMRAGKHRGVVLYPMTARIPIVRLGMSLAKGLANDGEHVTVAMNGTGVTDAAAVEPVDEVGVSIVELHGDGGRLGLSAAVRSGIVLVIDAPLSDREALAAPADCDSAIIVCETGRTTARQAQQSIDLIEHVGIPVVGFVSVGQTSRSDRSPRS